LQRNYLDFQAFTHNALVEVSNNFKNAPTDQEKKVLIQAIISRDLTLKSRDYGF